MYMYVNYLCDSTVLICIFLLIITYLLISPNMNIILCREYNLMGRRYL